MKKFITNLCSKVQNWAKNQTEEQCWVVGVTVAFCICFGWHCPWVAILGALGGWFFYSRCEKD